MPQELIALYPSENRDESRLLVVNRKTGELQHKIFKDITEYFHENDVLVFNNTKVFPARLYGNKEKTGAEIEVFLLRELNREQRLWDVLVDPARKIRIGNKLYFGEDDLLVAEVIDNIMLCFIGNNNVFRFETHLFLNFRQQIVVSYNRFLFQIVTLGLNSIHAVLQNRINLTFIIVAKYK